MNREEILLKSRQELKNQDLAEMEVAYRAGNISAKAAAAVCVLISAISKIMTGDYLISPWLIYFSMMAANWGVRFVRLKKKSDLLLGGIFFIIAIVLLVLQIIELKGGSL